MPLPGVANKGSLSGSTVPSSGPLCSSVIEEAQADLCVYVGVCVCECRRAQ